MGTIYTPEDFGFNSGQADNSAAWASMTTTLGPRGGIVVWPAAVYNFTNVISYTTPITHIGANAPNTGAGTVWNFNSGSKLVMQSVSGGSFRGITLNNASPTDFLVQFSAGQASGVSYFAFEDCNFQGQATTALIYITNALLCQFLRCRAVNSYTGGSTKVVWMDGSAFGVTGARVNDNVDNVEFMGGTYAGTSLGPQDIFVLDGKCDSTKFMQVKVLYGNDGLTLTRSGSTTQDPNFTYFVQGGFENQRGNAIRAIRGDRMWFTNFYASHNNSTESVNLAGLTDVVLLASTFAGNATFEGYIRGGKRAGYRIEGGRIQVKGVVANNGIRTATAGGGVEILSTVTSVALLGVDMKPLPNGTDGQPYAIRNLKGTSGIIIQGCDLSGRGATPISGTATAPGISGNITA